MQRRLATVTIQYFTVKDRLIMQFSVEKNKIGQPALQSVIGVQAALRKRRK